MMRHWIRLVRTLKVLALCGVSFFGMGASSVAEEVYPRFTVVTEGAGDTVLVLPGLTSSPDVFRGALSAPLNADVHWVTVAGFAGVPAPDSTDDFVVSLEESLVDYIIAEDLTDITLVGHSMGGVLSLLLAARLPDRVSRVLVIDAVPFLPKLLQPAITEHAAQQQAAAIRQQLGGLDRVQFLTMMRQGLPRQATSPEAQAVVFADIEVSDQASVAAATAELFATDYSEILVDIDAPVTVMLPHNALIGIGTDQLRARYEALYAGLETVKFMIVEDSRHFIMLDQPEAFEALLKATLEIE